MATMTIKFVTDSIADIPPDLAEQWGIIVVPCFVNYGGQSYADDRVALVRETFYEQLGHMPEIPTTSAMSPEFAREYIDPAFEGADHLIIITTPAKLSGILNAMRLGAAHLPQDKVTLIDSGQISLGIAWQVLNAAEVAAETGDLQKTLAAVEVTRKCMRVFAVINDLQFLRRSGRVGWATASIGALLSIKPVVQVIDGDILPIARVRTLGRAMDKMAELAHECAPLDKFGILHMNNDEGMNAIKSRIQDILPPDTIDGMMSPALGVHVGPGAVGFAAVSKGWKDAITA